MEWKITEFKFPRKLTRDEEDCFISAFQAIANKAKEKLKHARTMVEKNPLVNRSDQGKIAISAYTILLDNYNEFIRLEQNPDDAASYYFKIAHKNFEGLNVKLWKFQLSHWERLQKIMVDKVRKGVCRKIGISPDALKVEFFTVEDQPQ